MASTNNPATHFDMQRSKLSQKASKLFSKTSNLLCFEKPLDGTVARQYNITTPCEWNNFVKKTQDPTEHFCFIKKRHSWGHLQISEELLLILMSYYSIFPSFLQTIALFGVQISEGDRSVGFLFKVLGQVDDPDMRLQNLSFNAYELHYVLRYVEKHGRDLSNPWSMRKIAICHKFVAKGYISSWIIVHASKTLQERLTAARAETNSNLQGLDSLDESAASNHLLIVLDALQNWDDYIGYLSDEFKERNDRALVSNIVKAAADDQELEITLHDMQWLQGFIQNLCLVHANVSQNLDTLNGLCRSMRAQVRRNRQLRRRNSCSDQEPEWLTCIQFWTSQLKSTLRNVQMLKAQAHGCSELIYNIIKIKDNEVLQLHGQMLNVMTENSRNDDRVVLALTERSQKAAKSMQTLTFITLLYLPSSFLATLFGTNFFVVSNTGGRRRIEVVEDAWMYLVLAIPLTLFTVGIWAAWDRRRGKNPSLTP